MKTLTIAFVTFFIFTMIALSYGANAPTPATTVRKELSEMRSEAALKIQVAREKIAEWSDRAKNHAQEMSAETRRDVNNKIAKIEVLTNELEDKVEQLAQSSEREWNAAKMEYRTALETLDEEYQKLTKSTLPQK